MIFKTYRRLHDLVNDLLGVSKIQHGKLDYNITAFDFNKMMEDVIENIQYSSPDHSIEKTGKVSGKVKGDEDRLQQVIINLLTNAVKYSPNAKKVLITVAKENDELKVAVTDFGIGMPKANLEKIFERYYRIETDSVHFQGLGIGLIYFVRNY
jgi:signal transduction histidine kinase